MTCVVSGTGKPLALALALLGRWSVWPVLLFLWEATVITCRLWMVNPDLSPLGGCQVGADEGGAGRECKASHNAYAIKGESCQLQLQQIISDLAMYSRRRHKAGCCPAASARGCPQACSPLPSLLRLCVVSGLWHLRLCHWVVIHQPAHPTTFDFVAYTLSAGLSLSEVRAEAESMVFMQAKWAARAYTLFVLPPVGPFFPTGLDFRSSFLH